MEFAQWNVEHLMVDFGRKESNKTSENLSLAHLRVALHKLLLCFGGLLKFEHADIGLELLPDGCVVDREHRNVRRGVLSLDGDQLLVVLHVN